MGNRFVDSKRMGVGCGGVGKFQFTGRMLSALHTARPTSFLAGLADKAILPAVHYAASGDRTYLLTLVLLRLPSVRLVPWMRASSASVTYSKRVTTLETPETCEATMAARWPSSRVTTPIR